MSWYVNHKGTLIAAVYHTDKRERKHIQTTYDKCNICGWRGLSSDMVGNECPRCKSLDMDDIDSNPYED